MNAQADFLEERAHFWERLDFRSIVCRSLCDQVDPRLHHSQCPEARMIAACRRADHALGSTPLMESRARSHAVCAARNFLCPAEQSTPISHQQHYAGATTYK